MRRVLWFCLLALLACNTPGLDFVGAPPTRLSVSGATYDVRLAGNRAEAIRLNPTYAPRLGAFEFTARAAMEIVSGCTVIKIKGDAAQLVGTLDCKAAPVRRPARPRAIELDCYEVDQWTIEGLEQTTTLLDCGVTS